ncbi:MAG: ABC transporter permease [Bacteroidetes bacterium]|nr:ABC transporter permease [Bacteroidota bacterium]
MNFPLWVSLRYLRHKKSRNIIHFITLIAIAGIAFGTMSLITALSAFNGLEDLVLSLYDAFDPELKIKPVKGKFFAARQFPYEKIKELQGVACLTGVVEETILLKYKDKHHIAVMKGVSGEFLNRAGIGERMVAGEFILEKDSQRFAVIGYDVADKVGLKIGDIFNPLTFYAPDKSSTGAPLSIRDDAFRTRSIIAGGIFSIQQDFDSKYAIVPLGFAREMLQLAEQLSYVEVMFSEKASDDQKEKLTGKIREVAGNNFIVLDRPMQHELLYKIMKSEKWGVFLIVTLILIIAIFNLTGSVTMLLFDKKNDIAIMKSMGADDTMIKRIFLLEGIFISLIGNISGLIAGTVICFIQIKYKVITFQENVIIDAYPVKFEATDYLYVFLTVFFIGFISSYFPVRQLALKYTKVSAE